MAQRFCEVCNDPLPLESEESMCDSCLEVVAAQVAEIEEERCETPASVEGESSNETLAAMEAEGNVNTSESFDALDAISDMVSESPISETLTSTPEQPKKKKVSLPCEACGATQETLNSYKHPTAKEPLLLCDACYKAEKAMVEHPDDPMQGKVVHPDESEREEIITMDQEDAELYNKEVRLSIESPIEEVYARIELLQGKLQRAKLLLKASRTTLFMRIEHMKKDEREAEYKRLNERDAKKRKRAQPLSVDGTGTKRASSGTRAPKRSKAEVLRENLLSNGFPPEWVEEHLKKNGLI